MFVRLMDDIVCSSYDAPFHTSTISTLNDTHSHLPYIHTHMANTKVYSNGPVQHNLSSIVGMQCHID